jgi:hypothetical protein
MPSELLQKTISKARPRKGQCKESWYSNVPWETQLEMTRIENAHWNSSNEHVDNNYISTVKFLQLLRFSLFLDAFCIHSCKVHMDWEGHKKWRSMIWLSLNKNLQINWEIASNFCGLLRILGKFRLNMKIQLIIRNRGI